MLLKTRKYLADCSVHLEVRSRPFLRRSHAFFAQFAQEISAQAEASGRSSTINEADVIAVMKE